MARARRDHRRRRARFLAVWASKPKPITFRWLKQNLRDNGVSPSEVELTWAAIGSRNPVLSPFGLVIPMAAVRTVLLRGEASHGSAFAFAFRASEAQPPGQRFGRPPVGRTWKKWASYGSRLVTLEELIEPLLSLLT